MASFKEQCLDYHKLPRPGKLGTEITKPADNKEQLSMGYSPGVAYPVEEIAKNEKDAYLYTNKANLVGVITNGTAVLGLGNVGPHAAKPVMEGKGVLFKKMAGLDVFDLEVNEENPDRFIEIVAALAPTFGAINLEDIRSPDCFYIENELKKRLDIPVFHDDQHGTAIVVAAGLINALKVQGVALHQAKIVLLGAGAAGIAVANIILNLGANPDLFYLMDRKGVVHEERDLPDFKRKFAKKQHVSIEDAMNGAHVFIGLAAPNSLPERYLAGMADKPVVFALSNPDPEVSREAVLKYHPNAIYATGRSDLPNQINNVLAFPFILRAALKLKIAQITPHMIASSAIHLAGLVENPGVESIIPEPFDKRLPEIYELALSTSDERD
ncbi:malate dehydrogenase [Candidatus Comchoanobacter bicostacola]|uniref:Malate dehydrogenase n=1 Tax=Candidatus Comchoanobacter bicostacola TaxID=2919598 RepID=A0ABY5DHJ6_9GAMM|nr:malic enzyme-like NAD(P)-binding protein [Candidatus Comchoanobacter bicostacola]UTC24196.1 malate dehydrogenase [Candidatus Comchoanobacter bicostacola]